MKLDLNDYAINRQYIQDWYKKHGKNDASYTVSTLAPATMCPAIALAYYLAEDIGMTKELSDTIERLTKFYGYTEIKNKRI